MPPLGGSSARWSGAPPARTATAVGSTSSWAVTGRAGTAPTTVAALARSGGLPWTSSGVPDFEAARRSGGSVEPGMPGGYDSFTWVNGDVGQVTWYAASVRAQGSSSPQYVAGMSVTSNGGSEADRRRFLRTATDYLDQLPRDIGDARARRGEQTFRTTG